MTHPRRVPDTGPQPRDPFAALLLAAEFEVLDLTTHLEAAGIDALVIKGSVTERWLYPHADRLSGDVDILVAPGAVRPAEDVLMEMGFVSRFDGHTPDWVDQHGHSWVSDRHPLPVDLHRRIWGCSAAPGAVWDELWASRVPLALAPGTVHTPGIPVRCMLAAIHLTQHGSALTHAVEDLRRAIALESHETWRAAAAVAAVCGATAAFAAGLDALEGGSDLRRQLGLEDPAPADRPGPPEIEHLTAGGEGVLRLRRARDPHERLEIALREIFPSVGFMRLRSLQAPLARRGPFGLLAAYSVRWAYIARGLWRARNGVR